jgi:hypothetical protein
MYGMYRYCPGEDDLPQTPSANGGLPAPRAPRGPREEALAAVQASLDRRDNGGDPGMTSKVAAWQR